MVAMGKGRFAYIPFKLNFMLTHSLSMRVQSKQNNKIKSKVQTNYHYPHNDTCVINRL